MTSTNWKQMILALAIDVLFMYAVMYHEYRIGTFLWAKKPWVFFLCQTFVAVLFPVSTWLCL